MTELKRSNWIGILLLLLPCIVFAQGAIDIPQNGGTVSGIGPIYGWKCTAVTLTFTIDNGSPKPLLYGSSRGDTSGICGDVNNGFVTPWNWGLFTGGEHTIRVFDNGVQFAEATFSVTTLGVEYASGLSAITIAPQFPNAGFDTVLAWQESRQNFSIIGFQPHVPVSSAGPCEERYIWNIASMGQFVQLDNGTTWEIDSIYRIDTILWLLIEDVLVCDLKSDFGVKRTLVNVDRGDVVIGTQL